MSVAARRRHGIAVAPQQLFHRPDAALVAAGRAIDLGVLARDVPAAAFALAAAVALPERDKLCATRPGIGTERLLTRTLGDGSRRDGPEHQGEDREDRSVRGSLVVQLRRPRSRMVDACRRLPHVMSWRLHLG